jgi:hypothetical protein
VVKRADNMCPKGKGQLPVYQSNRSLREPRAILGLHYARLRKIRKIIVVTSEFHTRRAKWIFDRVFAGTSFAMAAAGGCGGLRVTRGGTHLDSMQRVKHGWSHGSRVQR